MQFKTVKNGYSPEQIDKYIDVVTVEYEKLQRKYKEISNKNKRLYSVLEKSQGGSDNNDKYMAQIADLKADLEKAKAQLVSQKEEYEKMLEDASSFAFSSKAADASAMEELKAEINKQKKEYEVLLERANEQSDESSAIAELKAEIERQKNDYETLLNKTNAQTAEIVVIAELKAEIESYKSENQSLLNKINTQPTDTSSVAMLKSEIDRQREQYNTLIEQMATQAAEATQAQTLKDEIEQLKNEYEEKLAKANAQIESTVLNEENLRAQLLLQKEEYEVMIAQQSAANEETITRLSSTQVASVGRVLMDAEVLAEGIVERAREDAATVTGNALAELKSIENTRAQILRDLSKIHETIKPLTAKEEVTYELIG